MKRVVLYCLIVCSLMMWVDFAGASCYRQAEPGSLSTDASLLSAGDLRHGAQYESHFDLLVEQQTINACFEDDNEEEFVRKHLAVARYFLSSTALSTLLLSSLQPNRSSFDFEYLPSSCRYIFQRVLRL